ncbi:unannotated protein [freshwater metagenome]|uniref:Unannotated protein n=1 Tax=freshwater metagenome TaxID=449393 RepID=A0A6J7GUQ5_9ZZZZ|nr:hypothetical protein [Actinomycetota bacterium]
MTTDQGRVATTAHPLCVCVQPQVMVASLLGCAEQDEHGGLRIRDDWPGPRYEGRVTEQSRAACPLHRPDPASA